MRKRTWILIAAGLLLAGTGMAGIESDGIWMYAAGVTAVIGLALVAAGYERYKREAAYE